MNAIQSVRKSCQEGNLESALDAHKILLSSANRMLVATNKENCSSEVYLAARQKAGELFEAASDIQNIFDVEVEKFPTPEQ